MSTWEGRLAVCDFIAHGSRPTIGRGGPLETPLRVSFERHELVPGEGHI